MLIDSFFIFFLLNHDSIKDIGIGINMAIPSSFDTYIIIFNNL